MPEIAEVARIVHFLRQRLVGKTILNAVALDDGNVFGKVGTSGKEVESALKGKKVVSAGSQGKYFWYVRSTLIQYLPPIKGKGHRSTMLNNPIRITLSSPPHLVMHFGMTGWVHIKGERTAYTSYYNKAKHSPEEWPPRFWKFHLSTTCPTPVHAAFVDSRRFGRVRLVHCPGDKIRLHSPLVENGPDPVVDSDRFTQEYLGAWMRRKRVPVKALLLDQAVISGIGNWVADETLYQARLHPEQYSNTFSDEQVALLHRTIVSVCRTAVDKLAESDEFPDDWLFKHRWGKGAVSALPNGEKLAFITVGGRTSCYAPNLQKKTGDVAPGIKAEPMDDGLRDGEQDDEEKVKLKKPRRKPGTAKTELDDSPPTKRRRVKAEVVKPGADAPPPTRTVKEETPNDGRRRSSRLRK